MSDKMEKLAKALTEASDAYRDVAHDEMISGYGSMDKVYDCVRNARNLQNKAMRVTRFQSVY